MQVAGIPPSVAAENVLGRCMDPAGKVEDMVGPVDAVAAEDGKLQE